MGALSISSVHAQGSIFSFAAGPSYSQSKTTGYQNESFVRLHAIAAIESTSDISPNAMYVRLGYHVKGMAVKQNTFYDMNNVKYPTQTYAMEFHNLSGGVGWKQRRPLGGLWYSYGFGLRLDYNLKAKYDAYFQSLQGTENKITYGVDVDLAMEFPISDLISGYIEFGLSPDLADQIFVPPQNSGFHYSDGSLVPIYEFTLKNLVFEIRAGFRFWRKVIYTD